MYCSCTRCALPISSLPELEHIDELVEATKNMSSLVVIEDKDISHPRCQFAACIALITRGCCEEIK